MTAGAPGADPRAEGATGQRTSRMFNAADFCLELACTPESEWPRLIGGELRKQQIADHFMAVAAQAPSPGPQQRAIVRAVFRSATGCAP